MSTIVTRSGKGSALTFTEMDSNFTNINTDKLENISEDTTPQLGGNLDVNGNSIVSASAGNITITPDTTGSIVLDGLSWPQADGTANYYLQTNGSGQLQWGAGGSGLADIVDDTTPQLGGNLDVNGNSIVSVSAGNIAITPDTTGSIVLDGLNWPQADGTTGQVLYTNGSAQLAFKTITEATGSELENVVEDITPQLGGNLDVQTNSITTSTANGDITLTANGTGAVTVSSAGGFVVADTAASGFGVISGDASKGLALATNDFAQAATDPQLSLTNGGGATLTAGTGSALGLTGASVTLTGTTSISNLNDFVETVYASTTTTGTYAPSIANGTIHYVAMTGSMTINAFTSPAEGQTITLFFDGTGGTYTLTLGASILTPGGSLALTSGGYDIVTITCIDDVTPVYVATAVNNFQ